MSEKVFGTVYLITNKNTGKIYIGQTINPLKSRLYGHAHREANPHLFSDIKELGIDKFEIEPLKTCSDIEEMNAWEMYYIERALRETPELLYNKNVRPKHVLSRKGRIENKQSRICMVRTKNEHSDYLIEKAKQNPDNLHNHVATEINALIKADFERAQRKAKRK